MSFRQCAPPTPEQLAVNDGGELFPYVDVMKSHARLWGSGVSHAEQAIDIPRYMLGYSIFGELDDCLRILANPNLQYVPEMRAVVRGAALGVLGVSAVVRQVLDEDFQLLDGVGTKRKDDDEVFIVDMQVGEDGMPLARRIHVGTSDAQKRKMALKVLKSRKNYPQRYSCSE